MNGKLSLKVYLRLWYSELKWAILLSQNSTFTFHDASSYYFFFKVYFHFMYMGVLPTPMSMHHHGHVCFAEARKGF